MLSLICGSNWWDGFAWGFGAGLGLAVVGAFVRLETRRLY